MSKTDRSIQAVLGIKIYLRESFTLNLSIGLHGDVLLLSTTDLSFSSDPAFVPLLIRDGIDDFGSAIDLRWGGNVEEISDSKFTVDNTGDYGGVDKIPFSQVLMDAGIDLHGKLVEYVLFDDPSITDPTYSALYTGICNNPEWTETEYHVSISAPQHKRVSNLTRIINTTDDVYASESAIGKAIPVTFGRFDGVGSNLARWERTANQEKILSVRDLLPSASPSDLSDAEDIDNDTFPITSVQEFPALEYILRIASDFSPSIPLIDLTDGTYYIKVVDGSSSASQYRAIVTASTASLGSIVFRIGSYFTETLVGSIDATAEGNTWVQIVRIAREYMVDTWDCKAYLDRDGNPIDTATGQGIDLRAYTDMKTVNVKEVNKETTIQESPFQFVNLPPFAYRDYDIGAGGNNHLLINVMLFDNTPDRMFSFFIIPPAEISLYDKPDLVPFGVNRTRVQAGLYAGSGSYTGVFSGNFSDLADRDLSTFVRYDVYNTVAGFEATVALTLKPPIPPDTFDSVYLLCGIDSYILSQVQMVWRRFIGTPFEFHNETSIGGTTFARWLAFPDFYLKNPTGANDGFFFVPLSGAINPFGVVTNSRNFTGYMNFMLTDIGSPDHYRYIREVAVLVSRNDNPLSGALFRTDISQIAFCFQKEVSIKDAIYTPFEGRIVSDASTWDGRYADDTLLDNPISVLEHVCRLQNWAEEGGSAPSAGWGKEYADDARINMSTTEEGGFDFLALTSDIKSQSVAGQILQYDDAFTQELKRDICQQFFLASHTRKGIESVSNFVDSYSERGLSTSFTLNLSSIIGDIPPMLEYAIDDIFCEPIIRYRKNYATNSFDAILQITNSSAPVFDPAYVLGVDNVTEAEVLWTMCHRLYERVQQINPAPADLTNLNFVRDYATARNRMYWWLRWQGASIPSGGGIPDIDVQPKIRLSMSIPWQIGKDLNLCDRGTVQLPHHTANTVTECLVEELTHNIRNWTTRLRVVLYGDTVPIETYIKDTFGVGVQPDWKDTFLLQVQHGEGADIKDIF